MVRPYVRPVWYLEGTGRRNVLYLENSGLGPAIVKSLIVHVDGHKVDLLAKGMHKEFVKILAARVKGIPSGADCFANTQPEADFVIRTDRPEPLLLRTENALVGNICTVAFTAALAKAPIKIQGRYESFTEDSFELDRVVDIGNAFPYLPVTRQEVP